MKIANFTFCLNFGVSWRTVYRRIEKDMLRAYKIGGSLRIKRWDLKKFENRAGY